MNGYRRSWCLAAGILALLAFHQPILREIGNRLTVNDTLENWDTLFLAQGEKSYAAAAEMFAQHRVRQIVLLPDLPGPLVACRIRPAEHVKQRRELLRRGVPSQAIQLAPGVTRNYWDAADRVREWLTAHPQERIVVITGLFHTRRLAFTLKQALTGQEVSRLRIRAVRDERFDESNWWQSRLGINQVVDAYVRTIHTRLVGRPRPFVRPDWRRHSLGTLEERDDDR